jgi:flagellar biogenesis protein FliO
MTASAITSYLSALAVVALVLFGLLYAVRFLNRSRLVSSSGKRLITVVESTFLAQNTTLHVVKVADRYYLVGGGMGHLSLVGEVPAEAVDPWLAQQRQGFLAQREGMAALLSRLRGEKK